ncbi:hypothetical protein ACHAPA_005500 [Fusarium lateritium]
MIFDTTSEETLEEMQDAKLAIICERIGLKEGEIVLDIGYGWGTLAEFASLNYGAKVTGVTLARNQRRHSWSSLLWDTLATVKIWLVNEEKVKAKYGVRWFRMWEIFLTYSTIASCQGSVTCFQIVVVKDINETHRINVVYSQYGLHGAFEAARAAAK